MRLRRGLGQLFITFMRQLTKSFLAYLCCHKICIGHDE